MTITILSDQDYGSHLLHGKLPLVDIVFADFAISSPAQSLPVHSRTWQAEAWHQDVLTILNVKQCTHKGHPLYKGHSRC